MYDCTTRAGITLLSGVGYTVSADLDLWLKRFELYVWQTGIPEDQWAVELLPLLDDAAFQVVLQLGLAESTDFNIITESLKQQFSPKGNELEWQRRLQTRRQQPAEQLVQYTGALRVLADKAYPNWTADQRGEVLRYHFIQGVSSPSVQLRLMREMPATLDATLTHAVQQQSVEMAQQRLYNEIHRGDAAAMALQQPGEKEGAESDPAASNAISWERACGTLDPRLEELSKELRRLSSELAQLRSDQNRSELQRRQGQRGKVGPTCWKCGKHGHLRRNCPHLQTPRKKLQVNHCNQ